MKKLYLYTFSGTGNTKLCGEFLKKYFIEAGYEVVHYIFDIKDKKYPDPNDADLIGIGYPIHAFNVPSKFLAFIKHFKKVKENKKYFIYKVSGEPFKLNDASSSLLNKYMKKKNFTLIDEKHFLMPYNIMFDYDIRIKKEMYLYLEPLCRLYVEEILNCDGKKIKYPLSKRILSFLFRIEYIAPKLNSMFVRVDNEKCTKCMLCKNRCPMQAIYINSKNELRVNKNCVMCMRCTLNCPHNAIKFGIMNPRKVNGPTNYEKIKKDSSIDPNYFNIDTKGYFKLFVKYFDEQDKLLQDHNIEIPIEKENK